MATGWTVSTRGQRAEPGGLAPGNPHPPRAIRWAVGFGVGTSDIEHLLATPTLPYTRLKRMLATVQGRLRRARPRAGADRGGP